MTDNKVVLNWINELKALTQPDNVVWIDGSESQLDKLRAEAVSTGEMLKLNEEKLPGCYFTALRLMTLHVWSIELLFAAARKRMQATNNWMDPREAYEKLRGLFNGSMEGRTMYVIPYSMGAVGSPFSKIGMELTDSIYVVLNMDDYDSYRAKGA